jgi:Fe-S cluster assembly protein SufD
MTRLVEQNIAETPMRARPWLSELRTAAMDRFQSVGYPTTEQEEWRLTNVGAIARTEFSQPSGTISQEARKLAAETSFGSEAQAELVFVNGLYSAELSRVEKLPRGVRATALSLASDGDWQIVERHLAKYAKLDANPFVALNTGRVKDGAVVHVSPGATCAAPLHLIFVSTAEGRAVESHPRVLVVADNNARLTVVESYVGGEGVHLTNSVTEIFATEDCRLDHSRVQRGGKSAFAVSTLAVHLGRGSQLINHGATLGGKLTRNDLNVRLCGEAADATINGLVLLKDEQHCDNHTLLDHAYAHCPSHELYKHVLADKSTCVFRGKILVRQDSQKTDSKQTSKSLLLSDNATMNSQPALEIYADDVKCTHGSTTGPVDEEMVFYLRSRGVGLEAARHLLTYAFAADVTRRIRVEPVRRRLEDFLAAQHGLPRDLRITDLGQHDEKAR